MNLQQIIVTLSLLSPSFLCIGMDPFHTENHERLHSKQKQLNNIISTQKLNKTCLIYKPTNDIASVKKQLDESTQLLEPIQVNALFEPGCECPNVMKLTDKPSKVLEIVAKRTQYLQENKQFQNNKKLEQQYSTSPYGTPYYQPQRNPQPTMYYHIEYQQTPVLTPYGPMVRVDPYIYFS